MNSGPLMLIIPTAVVLIFKEKPSPHIRNSNLNFVCASVIWVTFTNLCPTSYTSIYADNPNLHLRRKTSPRWKKIIREPTTEERNQWFSLKGLRL